jgi:hypothetical protein
VLGETEKLLRTAVRKDDENLMGFLLRLADVNHCDNVGWVMRKSGMRSVIPSRGYRFMFYPSLDLTLLASLASNDKEKLINATYPVIGEEVAQTATILAYGVHLPRYMVRMQNPKVCPSCLAESNYIRCVWDLAPVTACPIHTCMLLDKCQRCERLITWNRNKVSICRCNFDWRESATHPLQEQELALIRQVFKLCGFYSGQAEISQLTNNPLLSLKLDQLLSAVFFVSGQSRGVVDTKGKFLAPNLSNFELHSSLNAAFSIFENWPIRFNQFLEWRREQGRKLKLGTGLKNDFGKLYKCLYKEFSDKSFYFMRKAFEEYVQLSWDGGCTSQVGNIPERPCAVRNIYQGTRLGTGFTSRLQRFTTLWTLVN